MMDKKQRLAALVAMSRALGDPAADCAILGEGNTSARASQETFFVKASGFQLPTIDETGFTECYFAPVLALLEAEDASVERIKEGLKAAQVDPAAPPPSVETIMHALLLQIPGIEFVGHTHPTAVNAILCAKNGQQAFAGRLFPDEIVCCGPKYVWIDFTDPGVLLARAVNRAVRTFIEENGMPPKIILMQNHGCIALGPTPAAVENATMMLVKTARIIQGTMAFGGPNFLPPEIVEHIYARPDEKYREALLEALKKG